MTWETSNFYSTDRVDPDAPLEMKIKKLKKNFFVQERGGVPLKGTLNSNHNLSSKEIDFSFCARLKGKF